MTSLRRANLEGLGVGLGVGSVRGRNISSCVELNVGSA